ncbi:MAG: NosD domain-containing protein, partial [Candidatus Aenigmatarchaeota archaeon]
LTNNIANSNYVGIRLYSSSNNILTNNIASLNTNIGILLDDSSNNTLTNNIANSNYVGIRLYSSSNNILTNNIASLNTNIGILLDDSSNNILTNNTANSNSDTGIYFYDSSDNTLINNIANSNNYGIYLYTCNNNNIFYNKFCYNAFGLYNDTETNIIDNNTFCADFINPPSSWILSFSNISVNVSNILFTPTSCSLKINNQHYGFNDSVSDFQETRFEFSEISSEGIYNINVYCNDSIGTNYANNSIQIVIGDLSVQDILIEPSEVYTDTQITVKAKIYSTAQSSPKLKLFIDGNVYKYERVNLFSGINDLSYSIGALSAGEHTIKIEIDSDNEYSEINENNNILEKTITVKQYLTCPICPEPSEWSECINGIQTRVVWICGPQTGFVCKSNIETRTCYINISEEENITQNITPSENISQNITPSENITFPYQNFTNIIQSATNYILSQPPIS